MWNDRLTLLGCQAESTVATSGGEDKIMSLYAREIQAHLEEMYGTEVSPNLISSVTDAVVEEVKAWQASPLNPIYPIVYLGCIHVKVREGTVRVKAVYLAIGITMDGEKELLGLWLAQTEGAKFWLQVVTELRNRGVQDIFIACVDGLKSWPRCRRNSTHTLRFPVNCDLILTGKRHRNNETMPATASSTFY
jgi:transposase-like protein